VVLIGLMGSGKTSVGKELARHLGLPWMDLDRELERRHKRSVALQFELDGEPLFRRRERALLARLVAAGPGVISAGGGVVLDPANRALLRRCVTVYLQASASALAGRLKGPQALRRPLLRGGKVESALRRLARRRGPLYRSCAACTVRASQGSAVEVARRVAWKLRGLA
jgi:shikimate kinase